MDEENHRVAILRFNKIYNLLENNQPGSEVFRREMLAAYGLKADPSQRDPLEIAKMEEEFAKNCLSGKGSDATQMVQIHGDLRSVLAIEIGIIPLESRSGNDYMRRQWFGGDWIEMARLIICNSKNAQAENDSEKKTEPMDKTGKQLLKFWPIVTESFKGVPGNRVSYTSRRPAELRLEGGSGENSRSVDHAKIHLYLNEKLNPSFLECQEHKWILLPNPPSKLGDDPGSRVPENLWMTFSEYFEGVKT